ncbi:MAG: hypothetical protein NTY35_05650 [Planctomycetota bacterium]|nr:hypothetical protein [Planctomycetota bacterium]
MLHKRLNKDRDSERGSAIVGVLVVLVGIMGIVYATGTTSVVEVRDSRKAIDGVRASYLAEAGAERGVQFLEQAVKNTNMISPLNGLTSLFAGGDTITPFIGEGVMNDGNRVGGYTVRMTRVATTTASITIAIEATGYFPDAPSALPEGQEVSEWRAVRSTVRYSLAPSEVFDYAYFINNWGWFYGNTIRAFGNARSNGQFDCAGYAPTITGTPIYDSVAWSGSSANLAGYNDDNGNGLTDGNDGGTFAGWDIVGAQNVQGNGGQASNQHDFQDKIEMPNLSDLTQYEANAIASNSSITIDGVTVSNAVYGDQPGEKQNLYLVGTTAKPIVLNGPVVVRGDVLISGVVTGQGAIYSGRNVYCPKSVTYKNGPATPRPANNSEAATEAWMSANANKDFLGLFAREHIVVGDYTDGTWQAYVNQWMSDPLNASAEDAGADGIPNTLAGRDGILGTADDDVLEGDGIFTIEHYTEEDAALGLIPAGKSVGDAIPGTGEDIDGDGVYDPQATMAQIPVQNPLNPTNWGNLSSTIASYSSIASLRATKLDAVFYTNHAFCWLVLGSEAARINGGLVSRNESIIYGTPFMDVNQDARMLGHSSSKFANLLPRTVQPMEVLRWVQLDTDPNRYAVAP